MFLIFGFGPGPYEDLGPVVDAICPRCNNPVAFNLWHQRRWFKLFFIPILPTSSSHFLLCPICRWGRRIEGHGLEMTEAMMAMTTAYNDGVVDPEIYDAHRSSFLVSLLAPPPPRADLSLDDELRCEDVVDAVLRGEGAPKIDPAERLRFVAYSQRLSDRAMTHDDPRDALRAIVSFVIGAPEAADPTEYLNNLAGVVIMGEIVGIDVPNACAIASHCAVGPTRDLVRSFGEHDDIDTSVFPWEVVDGVVRRARPT